MLWSCLSSWWKYSCQRIRALIWALPLFGRHPHRRSLEAGFPQDALFSCFSWLPLARRFHLCSPVVKQCLFFGVSDPSLKCASSRVLRSGVTHRSSSPGFWLFHTVKWFRALFPSRLQTSLGSGDARTASHSWESRGLCQIALAWKFRTRAWRLFSLL